MKILSVVSTLDFTYRLGSTPLMWQLLKAFHQQGNTVITSTYLGKAIESPWWKSYANPFEIESSIYNYYLDITSKRSVGSGKSLGKFLIHSFVRPEWEKNLIKICEIEKPDCLLLVLVPLNHITGIATTIRNKFSIPVLYFDPDLPSSFSDAIKGLDSFKFAMYKDADLSEYDCYLSNSKGITPQLIEFGAKRVETVYYAADTGIFQPLKGIEQDIDIFYYGHRNIGKEKQFDYMMVEASKKMSSKIFVAGGQGIKGGGYKQDLGNCIPVGKLSLAEWRYWCARSKINLNITKDTDSCIYASSSARPFELGAMGCCIVSDPYEGMMEWFSSRNFTTVSNLGESIDMYNILLNNVNMRNYMSTTIRERILALHTYWHRAEQIANIIRSL